MLKKIHHLKKSRESWGSKIGIILAVAGSAIGLGNFLRFPVQAAQNGGGAFMIPYFIALIFLGIPLMWIEWTVGRFGGIYGHGTAPGIFHSIWNNRFIKYFGLIGIFGPLVIFIYYTYIESWLLGYTVFSITGKFATAQDPTSIKSFLAGYQGLEHNQFFRGIGWAYLFFTLTFIINLAVIYRGVSGGIEQLSKIAMPILLIAAIVIAVRVLTLGTLDPTEPTWNIRNGLGFLWNPDFSVLTQPKVWLAAAGQIFFTLSVGIGVILTYASYLSRGDDVALSGLTAVSINELAEVILGGSIVIPAAFLFFGPLEIETVANSGAFNLGFVTMPLIFKQIPLSSLWASLWFILLFLAGLTSSVSLIQPAVAFLEDEFNINRKQAVWIFGLVAFILCQPAIFFLGRGVVDELDFWGGTFCLVLFATIETILFSWIFGIDKAWKEIHIGADIRIPRIYKFIIKYITPLFLFFILGFWLIKDALPVILMKNVTLANRPYVLGTRLMLLIIFLGLGILLKIAWKRKFVEEK